MENAERHYWRAVATEWVHAPQRTWRAHSDAVNANLLDRWLPRSGLQRVLKTDAFDEAVSAGLYPQLAARAGSVIAIDISAATLSAAARKYAGLAVVSADLRCLPFADGSVDAIVSLSSLDHFGTLDELSASLRELRRVLSPSGHLVLTLDNWMNPLVALRNALPFSLLHGLGIVPYRVGKTVGPRRLRALLADARIAVDEVAAVVHVPRVIAVALANLVDRLDSNAVRRGFLGCLGAFEHLSQWPTRFLTGYFVAIRARRAADGAPRLPMAEQIHGD